jgi:3-hydroxyisobutyrate dehydrogenase-like beta-hydroxyacid dehydrogenase
LFDALGRKVLHAGRHGQGSALKLVFNQILGTALLGAAEALMLGDALDIDRDTLLEALEDCAALAPSLRSRMRASLSDAAHEPGFPLRWAEKDLRLATQTAAVEDTVLPLADVARSMYGLARVYGWGDKGITAVFEFLRGNRPATGEPSTSRQPSRPR